MTSRWRLYVDESGKTGDADGDSVAIAGILVPESECSDRAMDAERTKLRGTFPWLTWPLHRSSFTRPERHLLGFAATGWSSWAKLNAPSVPSRPNELMEQAAKTQQVAQLIGRLRSSNKNPRDPRHEELEFLVTQLPRSWAGWLQETRKILFARAAELIAEVIARHDGVKAFVVGEAETGAAASQRSSVYPFAPQSVVCPRYIALLEVLLRRVGDFLLSTPGVHELEVFASAIDVTPAKPLSADDIDATWQAAFGEVSPTRAGATVVRPKARVVPYADPNADPWFVVADFVSSLARAPLHTSISLAALGDLAPARAGVQLDVTTTAAAGSLHAFIQSERPLGSRAAGARKLPTTPSGWALDQARHWKAVPF
jgi:hypothetical protein